MAQSIRALSIALVLIVYVPNLAHAGMPSVTLTDVARMRVRTISFFLVGLLLSAWCVQLLWNYLRRDFSSLPRLSYGKALGVVALWGLLFMLVLTMISGARELLTPGAWEKQGLTYRLSRPPTAAPAEAKQDNGRREKLDRLRLALWDYARTHDGQFPASDSAGEISADLWLASERPPSRYLYVAGLRAGQGTMPLVYEPEIDGDRRLVLLADGAIKPMPLEEILHALSPEKP
ncbi:MAG TPA: hypothetical protein VH682_27160 [Gemmataceae bacterium]|jgi:hypothetical protein